ncbi:MAG: ATP-binding protein [Anaerolineae bacterium]
MPRTRERAIQVLVVEDEPLVVEMLAGMLQELNYGLAGVAHDGAQAVEMTQTLRPDVVLMDIGLARINGIDAATKIQQVCPTPVIILTAYAGRDMLTQAVDAGVGAYLIKPPNRSDLDNAITTVVARFEDMQTLQRLNDQLQTEVAIRQQVEEERERLLAAEREQRLLAEMLTEVTLALTSQTDYEMILDEILTQAQRLIAFRTAAIFRLERDELHAVRWQGYGEHSAFMADLKLSLDDFTILAEVIRSQKPYIVSDTFQDPQWIILKEVSWIRSGLFMPICYRQRVLGTLHFDSASPNAFTKADAQRLIPLANAAAIAIEHAQLRSGLEAEVAARTADIAAERDKSAAILRSAGDAIAVLDSNLRIQYVNPAFEQLTGYTADEILGKTTHEALPGQMPEIAKQSMVVAYQTATEWRGEMQLVRKDGRSYDASAVIAPIKDAAGTVLGYVFSHQDISRFKALDRARSQFIAGISHVLRTPLTILDLNLRKVQRSALREEDRLALDTMAMQIASMTHLTDDILEMAALDSTQGGLTLKPIILAPLITDTVRRYESRAAAAGLSLTCAPIMVDLPAVRGDHSRIVRMLSEIIENAIAYTPAGGRVTVQATTVFRDAHIWLTVIVRDTGPGLLDEERERIFERFFRGRLAESGHVLGWGLGLSIAQEIARAHGGQITVDSVLGEGTTFTIWLPAAA